MTPTERLQAATDRWHTLGTFSQTMVAAGLFGKLIGRSYSADAISTEGLAEMLEENVERAAREEAQELERLARTITEADE
jgi:hypothetical protein